MLFYYVKYKGPEGYPWWLCNLLYLVNIGNSLAKNVVVYRI